MRHGLRDIAAVVVIVAVISGFGVGATVIDGNVVTVVDNIGQGAGSLADAASIGETVISFGSAAAAVEVIGINVGISAVVAAAGNVDVVG